MSGRTGYSFYQGVNYLSNGGTDWKVYAKTALDITMTGVGFLGPIGFGISAVYYLTENYTDEFGGFGQIPR